MSDIKQTIEAFQSGVAEVRALGVRGKSKAWEGFATKSAVGFFDDPVAMEKSITALEKDGSAKGIYVTINPLAKDIIARANNRMKANELGSSDKHVESVRWIPVDIDPVRITGVSSSDAELQDAQTVTNKIYTFLKEHNISVSIVANSGNGVHLMIAVEMTAGVVTSDLIKAFLITLAQLFDTDTVKIDTVNFNPSRIWKVYGTTARKGDSTQERPHRVANIVSNKGRIVVPEETILSVVQSYLKVEETQQKQSRRPYNNTPFDLKNYLSDKGVEIVKEKQHGGAILYCLENCVFDSDHQGNEAAFGQTSDGVIFYQCFHESCKDKTWHDAKAILGWDSERISANVSNYQHQSAKVMYSDGVESRLIANQGEKPIGTLVKEYVEQSHGSFTVYQIDAELCLKSRGEKNARSSELYRLKKQGLIKQSSTRRGEWRIINGDLRPMDLSAAKPEPLPIIIPLGISELANIYPGNIIVIAGSPNAGKSAFVSTLIRECNSELLTSAPKRVSNNNITNIGNHVSKSIFEQMAPLMCPGKTRPDVHFFSSEAGQGEMASRLAEHPGGLEAFKGVQFWERDRDFADVIDPCGVNVIDYLEVYDNFYEIGSWINDIHRELSTGIAIIVIQKKRGAEVGKGGDVTLEKPRLYITLENNAPFGGVCKIIKAKFPKNHKAEPNGKEIDYKLSNGCEFTMKSDWRFVDGESERKKINRQYAVELSAGGYMFNFRLLEDKIAGLNAEDCMKWCDTYKNIDVMNYLEEVERASKRDPFLDKKTWFFKLSGMIENQNRKAMA